jgi:HD-GYP domain-containing protein (c-di-GMP phosphodiesterase class II)
VLSHHERWDGKGYPRRLKRDATPLGARILAVADAFDAMVSTRIYRPARSYEEAVEEILRCKGAQFDPDVVDAFLRFFERLGSCELLTESPGASGHHRERTRARGAA